MDYDLLIRGGTIIDGTGAPPRPGDLAVRQGRIAEMGALRGSARRTIDASGKVVAPGFIDAHTHYDAQVFWDRMLTISPWHGVTTVVMGNCGFGIAPTRPEHRGLVLRTLEKVEGMSLQALEAGLGMDWPFETFPEFLDAMESRGTAINVAALVGHTPIRLYVMGEEATERPATPEEVARMRELVRGALEAGAIGFATSKASNHVGYEGRPVPSRAAELAEIESLAGVLGEVGHGMIQATYGPGLLLAELGELARQTGRLVTWTALLAGMHGPGSHRPLLEQTEELQRRGLAVIPQVTGRTLDFEFQFKEPILFASLAIFKPVYAADLEGKKRIYADPEFRQAFRDAKADRRGEFSFAGRWEVTWISFCPVEPDIEERTVAEVAHERGVDPVDLALDLALATGLEARFRMATLNTDESEVEECLKHPGTALGLSDAGAHAGQLCDACFATSLLEHWVRDKGALRIEEAVRMLTSRAAEVFGITDRGRLAPGLAADIVVFDPKTVAASKLRRVRDLPTGAERLVSDAQGIEAVIVNGCVVRRGGKDTVDPDGPLPGKVLRHGHGNGNFLR